MSMSSPKLSDKRFKGKSMDRLETVNSYNTQRTCEYCKYLYAVDKRTFLTALHETKFVGRISVRYAINTSTKNITVRIIAGVTD
jgi:hypothetical protein